MNLLSDRIEDFLIFKDFGNSYILFKGKDGIFTRWRYEKGKEAEIEIRPILNEFEREGIRFIPLCDYIIGKGPDYYLWYGKYDIAIEVKNWNFKGGVKLSHYENEIKPRLIGAGKWKILYMEGGVEIGPRIRLLLKKDKIILVRTKDKLKRVLDKILRKIRRKAGKNGEVKKGNSVYEGFSWGILEFMKELMFKTIVKLWVLWASGSGVYEGFKGVWSDILLKSIF